MLIINDSLLAEVSARAEASPRKRSNHNFHTHLDDTLQRMLNALEPGTYVQPHKHEDPDKREAFIILKGRALVVEFDHQGHIISHTILSAGTGNYGAEIAPGVYHCILALEPGTVIYEVKDGPYSPVDDKNFAPWAPKEGEAGTEEFQKRILQQLNLI